MSGIPYQPSTSQDTSLSKPQAGSMQNYASGFDSSRSHAVLKGNLKTRVQFDVEDFLENALGTDKVKEDDFKQCLVLLNNNCGTGLNELKDQIRSGDEQKIYPPLVSPSSTYNHLDFLLIPSHPLKQSCMFQDIKENMKLSAEYHWQMVCTSSSDFDSEGLLLPDLKPDFMVADVSNLPQLHTEPTEPTQLKWRQARSIVEVKRRESDGLKLFIDRASTIKDLTAQGADYAHLLLAIRPFQYLCHWYHDLWH